MAWGREGPPADIQGRGLDEGGVRRGPGGVLLSGPGAGPLGVMMTVGPPWSERPPGAVDFNLAATLAGRDNTNTPAEFGVGAQITLPAGKVGVIRAISLLANNLLTSSDIRWALTYNDNRVSGWNTLTINPRAAGSVEVSWTPDETFIHVPEAARIGFLVTVNDAGTYQVSVQAHGWYYSQGLYSRALAAYTG